MAGRRLRCAVATAALLLSPALVTTAAADGGGDPSARELARQAENNLLHARSVRLTLTDRSTAARTSGKELDSMDLALDRENNCVGTLRMGPNSGSLEIVKRGDQIWMKPDSTFWKAQTPGGQGDEVAELLKDRYVHGSTHDAVLGLWTDVCDLSGFRRELTLDTSSGKPLTKGAETTVDGTKVIPLKGEKDGRPTTLYVTSDSPHLLVGAARKGDGTDRTVTLGDYDEPVPSATPSPEESVDVSELKQLLGS
ncbi:hypothetical protein [Streptomyces sp. NPDC058964]|uniref:hypothetical protein n=1 Tax=Streptomyces sp. NPDC058964 TaxID=3346681 RepID=UPI0036C7B4B3